MKRTTYQGGFVVKVSRASGDVWRFRYREDGQQKSVLVGTVQKYPTKALAERACAALRAGLSERRDYALFGHIIDRYIAEGMPQRPQTAISYRSHLEHVRRRWENERVDAMIAEPYRMKVWLEKLRSLDGKSELSPGTKFHIKAIMHLLFEFGIGAGIIKVQANPVSFAKLRNLGGPRRRPVLVSLDQFQRLIEDPELPEHVRVMVQLAMCTGMRASEMLGLRWEDIDFEESVLHIRRSVVGMHVGAPKTQSSEEPLPLHEDLAALLLRWKEAGPVPPVDGWVLGNPVTQRPYHRCSLQHDYLVPAGRKVGIPSLGFHAFRHSYRAMLDEHGVEMEVQRRLMRHSSTAMTKEYGKRRMPAQIVPANAKVVEMVMGRPAQSTAS